MKKSFESIEMLFSPSTRNADISIFLVDIKVSKYIHGKVLLFFKYNIFVIIIFFFILLFLWQI